MPDIMTLCTRLGAVLAVISTGLGIFLTFENSRLERNANEQRNELAAQKLQLEAIDLDIKRQDGEVRKQAEARAERGANRDYTVIIYSKVWDALEKQDPKRQHAVLALISTHPDVDLVNRLSGIFTQDSASVSPEVKAEAEKIQKIAAISVAQQQQLQSLDPGFSYDVFWCTDNPQNQIIASQIYSKLVSIPNRRVRLRTGWTAETNNRQGLPARGQEIRTDSGQDKEKTQGEALKHILNDGANEPFKIVPVRNSSGPTLGYISVWICNPT